MNQTQQPSNTPISAGAQVAAVVELLEHILLDVVEIEIPPGYRNDPELGVRTVLLAQQVSRDFQNTIIGSPKLQRKLFFAIPSNDFDRALNPFLTFHPPLSMRLNRYNISTPSVWPSGDGNEVVVSLHAVHPSAKYPRKKKPGSAAAWRAASWRGMYLCSGTYSVKTIQAREGLFPEESSRSVVVGMENPTLGQVLDVAFPRKFGK
ncbi:hypothetical protein HII31_11181 [Pseudocercospora fuligena]|uniref:Uncharacterized protein n=1 Tax=Pseudocercospora fuligena TaxID=685502 RepID=A0A8H6VEI6_9PEZI|nr:hypothetical protein HII31_11181 [Pseudocercospora fuligena]